MYPKVYTFPDIDYVKNGVIYTGNDTSSSILVESSSDLSYISGYEPGTIAFTAGMKRMWQLAANGTWVDMLGE